MSVGLSSPCARRSRRLLTLGMCCVTSCSRLSAAADAYSDADPGGSNAELVRRNVTITEKRQSRVGTVTTMRMERAASAVGADVVTPWIYLDDDMTPSTPTIAKPLHFTTPPGPTHRLQPPLHADARIDVDLQHLQQFASAVIFTDGVGVTVAAGRKPAFFADLASLPFPLEASSQLHVLMPMRSRSVTVYSLFPRLPLPAAPISLPFVISHLPPPLSAPQALGPPRALALQRKPPSPHHGSDGQLEREWGEPEHDGGRARRCR
ncbi:hypothetical protein MSAN_00120800 [Mycena sanguinolenta]|uniref:Uncharacterized protein n=1 Tax=Mycena sanguinolenta TaxID=230812 RepID=A0A8H6ZFZ8_9AGAR|nr:hypothetical protein MSAN_00120800 [Mycena sanguinolenta]